MTPIVSIHAPREGCDSFVTIDEKSGKEFQFTHPGRGATPPELDYYDITGVSIHAPREGCDYSLVLKAFIPTAVSIHAPREGCD